MFLLDGMVKKLGAEALAIVRTLMSNIFEQATNIMLEAVTDRNLALNQSTSFARIEDVTIRILDPVTI